MRWPLMICLTMLGISCLLPLSLAHASGAAKAEQGEEGAEKGKSGGFGAGDLVYVKLEPMVVPVISDNGAQQLVTFMIQLHVKDFNAADKLRSRMPQLTDAIFTALYGGLGQGSLRIGHQVNLPKVKKRIVEAVDKAIEPNLIEDVLLGGVGQRVL